MATKISKNKYKERIAFLEIYSNFDKWLNSIGLSKSSSATPSDYHYSCYRNHIDGMYGVECYRNDTLRLDIRFIRDRNKHEIMFVDGTGGLARHSEVMGVEQAPKEILATVSSLRDELLSKLLAIVPAKGQDADCVMRNHS